MQTLPALTVAINVCGPGSPDAITAGPERPEVVTSSADLAAIPAPLVVDTAPAAGDELHAAVVRALPVLREYIATLAEWETYDDAAEAMATVDSLARLIERPPAVPVDAEATARLYYAHKMHLWDCLTPAEQRERAGVIARGMVLTESPLVTDARDLDDLANGLQVALLTFLTKYDRGEASRQLIAAGLHDPRWRANNENGEWREDRFESILAAAEEASQVMRPIKAKLGKIVGRLTEYQFGHVTPVRNAATA